MKYLLKISSKFTGKHLQWSQSLLEKSLPHRSYFKEELSETASESPLKTHNWVTWCEMNWLKTTLTTLSDIRLETRHSTDCSFLDSYNLNLNKQKKPVHTNKNRCDVNRCFYYVYINSFHCTKTKKKFSNVIKVSPPQVCL